VTYYLIKNPDKQAKRLDSMHGNFISNIVYCLTFPEAICKAKDEVITIPFNLLRTT
jgi:hypothetical protein